MTEGPLPLPFGHGHEGWAESQAPGTREVCAEPPGVSPANSTKHQQLEASSIPPDLDPAAEMILQLYLALRRSCQCHEPSAAERCPSGCRERGPLWVQCWVPPPHPAPGPARGRAPRRKARVSQIFPDPSDLVGQAGWPPVGGLYHTAWIHHNCSNSHAQDESWQIFGPLVSPSITLVPQTC